MMFLKTLKLLLRDGGIEDALCWIAWGVGIVLMYIGMFAICK